MDKVVDPERFSAMINAIASVRAEGLEVSEEVISMMYEWAQGKETIENLKERIISRDSTRDNRYSDSDT